MTTKYKSCHPSRSFKHQKYLLGRAGCNKSWITDDLAHPALRLLESPGTLVSIGESDVSVLATKANDWAAGKIQDLASKGWVEELSNADLNGLERPTGADCSLGLTHGEVLEHGLRPKLCSLVLKDHRYIESTWAYCHKCRTACNLADFSCLFEGPRTFVGVGKGDVGILASYGHDGVSNMVENLTAEVLLGCASD